MLAYRSFAEYVGFSPDLRRPFFGLKKENHVNDQPY